MTQFDSPLGLSIRRWCAPLLGLEPLASADDYWARRSEIAPDELAEAMLPAAGVSRWVVDTGFKGDLITTPERLTELSGSPSSEILRLERLAEDLLEGGTRPEDFPDAFRRASRGRATLRRCWAPRRLRPTAPASTSTGPRQRTPTSSHMPVY